MNQDDASANKSTTVIYNAARHIGGDSERDAALARTEARQRDELEQLQLEVRLLRNVYESARSILRHNGVDAQKVGEAMDFLDFDVELVKQFDGGTAEPEDFELNASARDKVRWWDRFTEVMTTKMPAEWLEAHSGIEGAVTMVHQHLELMTTPARVPHREPMSPNQVFSAWVNTGKACNDHVFLNLVRAVEAYHQIAEPPPIGELRTYVGDGMFKDEKLPDACLGWAHWCDVRGQGELCSFLLRLEKELRKEDKSLRRTYDRIYRLCHAYESGVGHGQQGDGLDDRKRDTFADPDDGTAYRIGYAEGFSRPRETGITAAQRLKWLHTISPTNPDKDGYEWGIYRVRWAPNGSTPEVWQTAYDFSDMDAAMAAGTPPPNLPTSNARRHALRCLNNLSDARLEYLAKYYVAGKLTNHEAEKNIHE